MYTHPDIRTEAYQNYIERLEYSRTRLTIAAIEFRQKEALRHEAMLSKSSAKWTTLHARIAKRLAKLDEDISRTEEDLRNMQTLNNSITNTSNVLTDLEK